MTTTFFNEKNDTTEKILLYEKSTKYNFIRKINSGKYGIVKLYTNQNDFKFARKEGNLFVKEFDFYLSKKDGSKGLLYTARYDDYINYCLETKYEIINNNIAIINYYKAKNKILSEFYFCDLINNLILDGYDNFVYTFSKYIKYSLDVKISKYIIDFEYWGQDTLHNFLIDNKIQPHLLSNILFQIMATLSILHKNKIHHGDLNFGNILVRSIKPGGYWNYVIMGKNYTVPNLGYVISIIDFGISQILDLVDRNLWSSCEMYTHDKCIIIDMLIGENIIPISRNNLNIEKYNCNCYYNFYYLNKNNIIIRGKNTILTNELLESNEILSFDLTTEQIEYMKINNLEFINKDFINSKLCYYRYLSIEVQNVIKTIDRYYTLYNNISLKSYIHKVYNNIKYKNIITNVLYYKNRYPITESKMGNAEYFINSYFNDELLKREFNIYGKLLKTYNIS